MNITDKLAYTDRHIESISQHHDVDASVRLAALERVKAKCDAEAVLIQAGIDAEVSATLKPVS